MDKEEIKFNELVDKRINELSKEWKGDFKALIHELVYIAGKDDQSNYKLWNLTGILIGQDYNSLSVKYARKKHRYIN